MERKNKSLERSSGVKLGNVERAGGFECRGQEFKEDKKVIILSVK